MGMFDYVNFSFPCPTCGETVSGFQTKGGTNCLEHLDPIEVDNFYDHCTACHSWIEFNRKNKYKKDSLIKDFKDFINDLIGGESSLDDAKDLQSRLNIDSKTVKEYFDVKVKTKEESDKEHEDYKKLNKNMFQGASYVTITGAIQNADLEKILKKCTASND